MEPRDEEGPRARLFIALDLPESVRRGIAGWGGDALRGPALQSVGEVALHMTLVFLGSRPEGQIGSLARIVATLREPAPFVELSGPVGVPPRAPRLYALEARSPGAVTLQAQLEGRLREAGLHDAVSRPFWPHVTVARVRHRKSKGQPGPAPGISLGEVPEAVRRPFRAVRVTLYRSVTKSAGAEYTPLAQVELPRQERATVR